MPKTHLPHIPTSHLLWTFALVGPPVGFIAAIIGVTSVIPTPEGIYALIYGLHPIGLALIYAAGLAPALATAGVLILLQDRDRTLTLPLAVFVGFAVTLAYGVIATSTAFIPNAMLISLALAGVGASSAVVCVFLARCLPKILAEPREAR